MLTLTGAMAQYQPSDQIKAAQQEFRDQRFGIFIHWGIYSMMGDGEWVMQNQGIDYKEYERLANVFYPSKFNAKAWARAIKNAGAKYVTFTTRHHDSFSMFKTATSDYNIVDGTPYKHDVLKDLADACEQEGLSLHLYYSHLDWHRTDYPIGRTGLKVGRPKDGQNMNSYLDFMKTQLTELLTNYGKIGCIWFDGWWDHDFDADKFDWHLQEQYDLIHRLQPQCLVANNHHHDPFPGEDIQIFERDVPGENKAGYSSQAISDRLPLETCQTMNDTWGYNINDKNYKSADELIQLIASAAGRDANLLLNIGPRPDGSLPEKSLQLLEDIGNWMRQNGETIYGTRGGIVKPHDWGVTTQKGKKLYVHIFKLQDKSLFLPLAEKVKSARMFATGKAVKTVVSGSGIVLNLDEQPKGADTIVELTLK